jgi:hypothetical protein
MPKPSIPPYCDKSEHDIVVMTGPFHKAFIAACSCGWEGTELESRAEAEDEANEHDQEMIAK